jgi:hypothetical protein
MKQPCKRCPFRRGMPYGFRPGRAQQMLDDLSNDRPFHCHETIDYSEDASGVVGEESQLCFGAALFLEQTAPGGCRANFSFRVGLAVEQFGLTDLRLDDQVYATIEEFIAGSTR